MNVCSVGIVGRHFEVVNFFQIQVCLAVYIHQISPQFSKQNIAVDNILQLRKNANYGINRVVRSSHIVFVRRNHPFGIHVEHFITSGYQAANDEYCNKAFK